ncbi:mechanosensitive ion channel family protein [Streptosporangium lutulentum]
MVVGIAAQSTLGNLLAGLQLAFSDALRLDDVVVIQEQWGRIEELSLTYVVVRLWDERRLVLPVSYFTSNSFENWTRHGSRVIGAVFLRLEWSVPVDELRAELYRALREHPLWDQKDWTLQVTDTLPNGLLELRALMSAADSPSAWDLKCDMREHMVKFIRDKYPEALPRFRVDAPDEAAGMLSGLFAGGEGFARRGPRRATGALTAGRPRRPRGPTSDSAVAASGPLGSGGCPHDHTNAPGESISCRFPPVSNCPSMTTSPRCGSTAPRNATR